VWRGVIEEYRAHLPVTVRTPVVTLLEGGTPLITARFAAPGRRQVWLKCEAGNPTGSFKDRGMTVAVSKAVEAGARGVICASTGNTAASASAYAARAGMRACVFIPRGLERGKVLATSVYRPTIVEVDGNYDEVNRLCAQIAEEHRWAFVNVNLRPYYSEGGKTLGFEVAEQLGWRAPDHVVVPIASGSLLVKIHKGLSELHRTGVIPSVRTKTHGAQAEGCAPVANAFAAGQDQIQPVKPQTIARSLAIGDPADGRYVLRLARENGGRILAVSDEEIVEGISLLAESEGVFTETAGGVTVGVLRRLAEEGVFGPEEVVVAYITGMGLKTAEAVEDVVAPPIAIRPTLRDFESNVLSLVR